MTRGSVGPAAPRVQRAVTEDVVHRCALCPSGPEHYSNSCQAARRHGNEQEQGKRGGRAHLDKSGKLPVLIKRDGSGMQQPSLLPRGRVGSKEGGGDCAAHELSTPPRALAPD
ncbi:hypothetical protein AOLI_G00007070 [Acnodon oligacanthus]